MSAASSGDGDGDGVNEWRDGSRIEVELVDGAGENADDGLETDSGRGDPDDDRTEPELAWAITEACAEGDGEASVKGSSGDTFVPRACGYSTVTMWTGCMMGEPESSAR